MQGASLQSARVEITRDQMAGQGALRVTAEVMRGFDSVLRPVMLKSCYLDYTQRRKAP